uniref:ergosterol biosynthetic protein 28 homolog isoform X1 n=2 Tax=Doryrhamphus excisus TaxID=161450 RepID=UPI0025ADA8E7|nr:ergosterol biosynthetic protein 28 homolog isoform X1 [Doryrhamphus excisus]
MSFGTLFKAKVTTKQLFLSGAILASWESSVRSGAAEEMSRFLNVLRSWLVMVSVIAMGNTVQSFRDHSFLSEKLYTGTPQFVNGLQARTFGIWTLLSSIIRCACAIDIQNRTLYHITLWTFVLALGHFLSETFIYKTAPLTIGVMAPLIVASFSVIAMLIGFQCFPENPEEVGARQKKRN